MFKNPVIPRRPAMRPHIRGRRRSLDQQKKVEICDLVARGASVEEAAEAVGVSVRTVQREAKLDEDFDHELRLSQRCTPDPLKIMESAARTHWRAAAWLLERTDPDTYAKRPASSASPYQFEAGLALVVEAALDATAPQQRGAVYQRLQAACDTAFKCVFPDMGLWGRRTCPTLPPTPLADEQWRNRVCHVPDHCPVADKDATTVQPGALQEASPTPILRIASNGRVTLLARPEMRSVSPAPCEPPSLPQAMPPNAASSTSTFGEPNLSPKMHLATEFEATDKLPASPPHSATAPDPLK